MPQRLSIRSLLAAGVALFVVVFAALAGGCTDPSARFNEFDDRVPLPTVPDGGPDAMALDMLPDVTGEFLLSMSVNISPTTPIQFRMENVLTQHPDGTGELDTTITALTADAARVPVGNPFIVNDIPVAVTGEFMFTGTDVMIPGEANPITGSDIVADVVLTGQLRSPDLLCGDLGGMVKMPLTLALSPGSFFGGIRVTPGATGAQLPDPVSSCPVETPDAGVPDASIPDAGVADVSTVSDGS
jgi:hypothetical protein